jgi:transcriptional regulator with XRE-family HTH domain
MSLQAELSPGRPPPTDAESFAMAGLVLFGARWKAPLARKLGVSRETVSRWVSGGDVPKWARNTVALLNAGKGSVLSLCDRTGNMGV